MSRIGRVKDPALATLTSSSGVGGTLPPPSVEDLLDVDVTGISDGDVIIWDDASQTWIVGPMTGGAGATFGTPAIVLGTAAANGSIDEVIRRDATIVAFDGTVPVTQALGDSAATGSAAVAARRDHKHGMPPAPMTTSGHTMATARLLGRTSASTGAVEEISVGTGLTLSAGSLSASGSALTVEETDASPTDAAVTKIKFPKNELTIASHEVTVAPIAAIIAEIDGAGNTITTGVKGDTRVPFDCTILSATLLADQTGSIVVNIWKDTLANYPPTSGDKITSTTPPTISGGTNSEDTTLSSWTTTIAAGDTLRFNVDSVTSIGRVTLILKVKKT